jgi:hypothetical protein
MITATVTVTVTVVSRDGHAIVMSRHVSTIVMLISLYHCMRWILFDWRISLIFSRIVSNFVLILELSNNFRCRMSKLVLIKIKILCLLSVLCYKWMKYALKNFKSPWAWTHSAKKLCFVYEIGIYTEKTYLQRYAAIPESCFILAVSKRTLIIINARSFDNFAQI